MTGIRERRFFPRRTPARANQPRERPNRPFKPRHRPAQDRRAGARLGLPRFPRACHRLLASITAWAFPPDCLIYDVSNACLGILTGMIQVANMIELGQIRAGLVVGTESGRQLVENTIERLNTDHSLTRRTSSIRSRRSRSARAASRSAVRRSVEPHRQPAYEPPQCSPTPSITSSATAQGMETFMQTDSEQLMNQGVATGAETFAAVSGQCRVEAR